MSSMQFANAAVAGRASITDASQVGLDILGDFTIEFWIRSNNAGEQDIILKRHSAGSLFAYNVFKRNQVDIRVQVSDAANLVAEVEWAGVVTDDGVTWDHIAISCDISNATATKFVLYRNGVSQGNGTVITAGNPTAIRNGDGDFQIGGADLHVGGLVAEIFDVRIWSVIRTGPQILANYNVMFLTPSAQTSLVSEWLRGQPNNFLDGDATNTLVANDVREVFSNAAQPTVTGPVTEVNGDIIDDGPSSLETPVASISDMGVDGDEADESLLMLETPVAAQSDTGVEGHILLPAFPVILGVIYRMRGFDTVKGHLVFWDSTEVDDDASDYTTPGDITLSTIRIMKVKGDS
jgi:hypothetical protein